jgi:AbiV family abortive infection protein
VPGLSLDERRREPLLGHVRNHRMSEDVRVHAFLDSRPEGHSLHYRPELVSPNRIALARKEDSVSAFLSGWLRSSQKKTYVSYSVCIWLAAMTSERARHREMANACFENARKMYLDSMALRERKSRGHAYSLLVLSIEEAVKALIYRLASDGIVHFSKENSDDHNALKESDLLKHKVKHSILAEVMISSIMNSPFFAAFEGIPQKKIEVSKAKEIVASALATQQVMTAALKDSRSQLSIQLNKFVEFLGKLDEEKNLGFYVGKKGAKVRKPNEIPIVKYAYWRDFQESFLESTKTIVREGLDPDIIRPFKEANKAISRRMSKLRQRNRPSIPAIPDGTR